MSYTKHTWQTGEIITAENLNNMESGIKDVSPYIVTITYDSVADKLESDMTLTDILDLLESGKIVYAICAGVDYTGSNFIMPCGAYYNSDEYKYVEFSTFYFYNSAQSGQMPLWTAILKHITIIADGTDEATIKLENMTLSN